MKKVIYETKAWYKIIMWFHVLLIDCIMVVNIDQYVVVNIVVYHYYHYCC